jgi:uncharacterized damage-inducible protein DinB
MKDHFQRLFDYHHWAADRLFGLLGDVTADELDKPWGGSFKTGRGLLSHIVDAEQLWNERFRGTSPSKMPQFPATHAGKDYLADWKRCEAWEAEWLRSLTSGKVGGDFTYTNMKGETLTLPLADILTHLVNHGTYHRGQLSHLLKDLGRQPVGTDYVLWVATKKA